MDCGRGHPHRVGGAASQRCPRGEPGQRAAPQDQICLGLVCSYGWGSKAIETIAGLIPNLKVEMLPTVLCQGAPREADLQAVDALAEAIALKHRESGLLP